MLETEGALSWLHTPSFMSFSRISHANMLGFLILYELIDSMTDMVATLGFEPPMSPGFIEPVELNLKITHGKLYKVNICLSFDHQNKLLG